MEGIRSVRLPCAIFAKQKAPAKGGSRGASAYVISPPCVKEVPMQAPTKLKPPLCKGRWGGVL